MRFESGWRRRLALGGTALAVLAITACGDDGDVARAPEGDEEAARGQEIFQDRCSSCHSTTGGSSTGPHLDGIYGEEVELRGGDTVVVDEAYLARSIADPGADVVDGYQPIMPDLGLSADEVDSLVAYIRSLQ